MKRLLPAALLLVCTACGGSSATPELPLTIPTMIDVGVVSANTPSTFRIEVTNPNTDAGQVTHLNATGVMSVPAGQVPLVVPGGATLSFQVLITPLGALAFSEMVTAAYSTADGTAGTIEVTVTGQGANVTLFASPASVDFGDVLPGTTADRTITLQNDSTASTTTVTGATVPTPEYEILSPSFPIMLSPGATADVTLRYTGGAPGAPAGDVAFPSDADSGSNTVAVQATTGGEEITDFGTVNFNAGGVSGTAASIGASGITDELTFDVPADAIGFLIEATTTSGSDVGLGLLTGPNGEEFENENLSGPYFWVNAQPFTAQIPNTDRSNVQLPAGGGTYKLKLLRFGNDASCSARVIVERRPAPNTDKIGVIDLNVFLANGLSVTAATAPNNTFIQGLISAVDQILAPKGIRIGDKKYYDVTNPAYDSVTSSEFGPMLQTSSMATDVRLNLYFVQAALPDVSANILGVAATLGGPKLNGTSLSGVMSEVGTDASFYGLVAAHEICHFLGLAHTREQSGSWDDINDTTNYTSGNGGYLMHWQASGGTNITEGQALVIRAHPHIGPALVIPPPFQQKPQPFFYADPTAPQEWCGTCQHEHGVKGR